MNLTIVDFAPPRQLGPWALGPDPGERLARLRSLPALARVLAGPRAVDLVERLQQAETDPAALVPAADALDRLAALDMRKLLAPYVGLVRPLSRRPFGGLITDLSLRAHDCASLRDAEGPLSGPREALNFYDDHLGAYRFDGAISNHSTNRG